MKLVFVTGNLMKAKIARDILSTYNIEVIQQKVDTPEIQAQTGKAVVEYSAQWASKFLKMPVVKTDVSYCIPALNNFPGPFVKFINEWLSAQDILKLMHNKTDRRLEIVEFLTYATPEGTLKTFEIKNHCKLAREIADNTKGSTFDKIIIRDGSTVPQNLLAPEQLQKIFNEQLTIWHELGKYLKSMRKAK